MASPVEIGVIGGTGVYGVEGLTDTAEFDLDTPFGKPSSKIIVGTLGSTRLAFLARHDATHRLTPTEIPFRANIYALKTLGVKYLLSFGACGSLKEDIRPQDVVLVDQFIDNTKHRQSTFFGDGIIAHVAMGEPVCAVFAGVVKTALEKVKADDVRIHTGGTYICIEGPAFSTKAESHIYRSWNGSVIGMTAIPEAKLAREAEIAYTCVALVTDYDCWHPDHDQVTVELVLRTLKRNGDMAQRLIKELAASFDSQGLAPSKAHSALNNSILTHKEHIGAELRAKLKPLIGKYLDEH